MASQDRVILFVMCLGYFAAPALSFGLIEGLYCGKDVCYDVLGVTREATKGEITKAYRKLARKWHPDMHRGQEAKDAAEEKFTKIAGAYEILRDEEGRKEYDYMLDNPEEMYAHYFNYYRRHMAPKVDIRIVLSVSITVISVIQYWSAWNNYNTALSYLVTVPKYRMRAKEIAESEKLIEKDKKKLKGKSKQEIRDEEEQVLKQVIENKMDIRGGYSKPSVLNILWIQLLFSPYYLVKYIIWYIRWLVLFTILRREYGDDEKAHIMRKNMGLSQLQWEALEDYEREDFFKGELWIKEKFKVWKKDQEEEMKAKLANSSKYKAYRRYMKKGGPGQITFIDDE